MIQQRKIAKRIFGKTSHREQCTFYLCAEPQNHVTGTTTHMNQRLAISLIALATLTRLLPHPHNFTPIGAIALFGAAYYGRQYLMLLVPFAALFLSDLFINNVVYSEFTQGQFVWITSVWIYLSFALVMAVGMGWLGNKITPLRVLGASLSGSLMFFLVSNFSTWLESSMYAKNIAGLMACYTAGIPFFGNTLMGDLVYSAALFGAYAWLRRKQEIMA
jgi:hypothetical protein